MRDEGFRILLSSPIPHPGSFVRSSRKQLEKSRPAVRRTDRRTHRLGASAVAGEESMHEVHLRAAISRRRKRDLHLARFRQVRLVSPFMRDLSRHDEAARRIPDENLAPVAFRSVFLFGVAATPGALLDQHSAHR